MKRGSSVGGLKVKALTWNVRDAGLSPAQCYTFHLYYLIHSKRKLFIIHISELRTNKYFLLEQF